MNLEELNNQIDKLEQKLMGLTSSAPDYNQVKKLKQIMTPEVQEKVINILMKFVNEGTDAYWKQFVVSSIVDIICQDDEKYAYFFENLVNNQCFLYYSSEGLLKTLGARAYPKLIEVFMETDLLGVQANIIKNLSIHSKQTFDRALPTDPGSWKEEDVTNRFKEVLNWQKEGYLVGEGYAIPYEHPSLFDPKTKLEEAAAKLNRMLIELREKNEIDPANIEYYLSPADADDMKMIEATYSLPKNYLDFLRFYSPINVSLRIYYSSDELRLYGAKELITNQEGYAYNSETKAKINEWPSNMLVIADFGNNPICIDMGSIKKDDAPIYFACHGTGEWKFELIANSFVNYLKRCHLIRYDEVDC